MLGLAAVCLGVAALAAAAFVLSYSGIRAVALGSGISARHAGDYPVLIDAMLVIALLAVLGLRGAGLPSRILSWLALLAVLGVAAAADVQNATGRVLLQYDEAATTAAVLPWALVFLAFVLLFALLRHGRMRHQASVARRQASLTMDGRPAYADQPSAAPPAPSPPVAAPPVPSPRVAAPSVPVLPVRTPRTWDSASIVPGFSARLVSSAAAGAAAGAAATDATEQIDPAPDAAPEDPPAQDADAAVDDPPAAPADAAAEPEDPRAAASDAAAEPEDPPAAPADAAAEPEDPPAADSGAAVEDPPAVAPADAGATPGDTGSAGAFPATDESAEPGTSDLAAADLAAADLAAADQGAADDVPDNMPVFHRMWSTPTPPDS
jgi:hypothetical protein